MPEKENGLYYSDREDSYKSLTDIEIKKMGEGNVSIEYPDRYITELSFEELNDEMISETYAFPYVMETKGGPSKESKMVEVSGTFLHAPFTINLTII